VGRRRDELLFRSAGFLGKGVLHLLGSSLRIRREGGRAFEQFREQGRPVVFVFWHSRLLPLAYIHRGEGVVVLVSRHSDGEYIARVVERMGFGTARGSSTRGGMTGLRQLLRAARDGRDLALTPDGPKGPLKKFKWGALLVAQRAGFPVIPVGLHVDRAWILSSWDRFVIPRPFARIDVRYGDPHEIPPEWDREQLQRKAEELEGILNHLTFDEARTDSILDEAGAE